MGCRLRRHIIQIGAFCLAVIGLAQFSQPAFAEIGDHTLRLTPTSARMTLDPGDTYSGAFTVINAGTQESDFVVGARPYDVNGENYDPNYNTVNAHTQITDWVTFEPTSGHLAPGESVEIHYTIDVPTDVPGGGQYCALFASTDNSASGETVQAIGSVGMLVLAQVNGDTRLEGTYSGQHMSNFITTGSFSARSSFTNTGNVDYVVTSTVTARNFFTGNYDFDNSSDPSSLIVLPDHPRTIVVSWPDSPMFGVYEVSYTIKFLGEEHTITQFAVFFPLWAIFAIIFLIVFIVVWVILSARRRHRHSLESVL